MAEDTNDTSPNDATTMDDVYANVEKHETDSGYLAAAELAAERAFRKQQAMEADKDKAQ